MRFLQKSIKKCLFEVNFSRKTPNYPYFIIIFATKLNNKTVRYALQGYHWQLPLFRRRAGI